MQDQIYVCFFLNRKINKHFDKETKVRKDPNTRAAALHLQGKISVNPVWGAKYKG